MGVNAHFTTYLKGLRLAVTIGANRSETVLNGASEVSRSMTTRSSAMGNNRVADSDRSWGYPQAILRSFIRDMYAYPHMGLFEVLHFYILLEVIFLLVEVCSSSSGDSGNVSVVATVARV